MAIYLSETDVTELLEMSTTIEAVEESFRLIGEGKAQNQPRRRVMGGESVLHFMAAGSANLGNIGDGATGVKVYTSSKKGVRFTVLLYNDDGTPLAVIQANKLGQFRTGAASGVASRYLAREDSSKIGIIGTGWQARGQLLALKEVRSIEHIRAFGRDGKRCQIFCQEMEEILGIPIEPTPSAKTCVQDADIIVTATRAKDPILDAEWIQPGTHINAVGSNWNNRREMDTPSVLACQRKVVDNLEVAQLEAGDLIIPVEEGALSWEQVEELGEIAAGVRPGRESEQEITLFCSQGMALEDIFVGRYIYEKAIEKGLGTPIEP